MEESSYKSCTTLRGLTYRYYISKAETGKPTLLFLHGFPNAGFDWLHQVVYFKKERYGVIVPDMLGYGGSDKPTDPSQYMLKLMSKDLVDILDEEHVDKAIGVGHDWGAGLLGRLAVYHKDRFLAFAFFAVGYIPPNPNVDPEQMMAMNRELFGEDIMGYAVFISEDKSAPIIDEHIESFISASFGTRSSPFYSETFSSIGGMEKWLLADNMLSEVPKYSTKAELKHRIEVFRKNGMAGPSAWYKAFLRNMNSADEAAISPEDAIISHPVFYCGGTKDKAANPVIHMKLQENFCPNITSFVVDGGHLMMVQFPDAVNESLHKWIKSKVLDPESSTSRL